MKNPRVFSPRVFCFTQPYLGLGSVGVAVETSYCGEAVVLVSSALSGEVRTVGGSVSLQNVWVGNHAVTGLERDTGLESSRIDSSHHLERNVWAVEDTCIIR